LTGIAGWVGRAGNDLPSDRILARMLDAGHRHTGAERQAVPAPDASVGIEGWPEDVAAVRDGDLFVAVYGRPVWRDAHYRALMADLAAAAAVAHAWRDRSTDLFSLFGGPVSVAMVDRAADEALIAIDRIGIRQMAFARTPDGGLAFASDARAVCAHPSVTQAISPQGIYNYLYCYVSPGPPTIFDGVEKLQPGQYAHLKNGTLNRRFYWQPVYGENAAADVDELARDVRAGLDAGVGAAVDAAGDATVGAFLSGGLDSTSVSGILNGLRPGAPCFTIAFPEERYNELPWAEEGAAHFGAEHIVHYLTPEETLDAIPGIVEAHDEPYGNSSSVPAYVCAAAARDRGVDVLLAGDGGDEIFTGNERYVEQRRYDAWYRIPGPVRKLLLRPLLRAISSGDGDGSLARARAYADRASMPLPDRLQAYNLVETTPARTMFDLDFIGAVDAAEPRRLLGEVYNRPADATELKRMQFLDLHITLADNDLRKVNRACEAAGIRVAYPMLDEALFDRAAAIPSDVLLSGGRLRGFYKDMMADFLPASILNKPKHGFGMPFAEWTRAPGALRDLAEASLRDFDTRRILRPGLADELRDDLTGVRHSRFGGLVWDVMMLELWLARHARPV